MVGNPIPSKRRARHTPPMDHYSECASLWTAVIEPPCGLLLPRSSPNPSPHGQSTASGTVHGTNVTLTTRAADTRLRHVLGNRSLPKGSPRWATVQGPLGTGARRCIWRGSLGPVSAHARRQKYGSDGCETCRNNGWPRSFHFRTRTARRRIAQLTPRRDSVLVVCGYASPMSSEEASQAPDMPNWYCGLVCTGVYAESVMCKHTHPHPYAHVSR
jgi:hypothetical protein